MIAQRAPLEVQMLKMKDCFIANRIGKTKEEVKRLHQNKISEERRKYHEEI
jgi:hypothetical protein